MPDLLSPGVVTIEKDASNIVPSVATSIAAFVGNFDWGPVDEVRTVSSESILAYLFGTPSKDNAVDFTTAAYYLKYSQNIKVVRAVTADAFNANGDGNATTLVTNRDNYDGQTLSLSFIAKYPGTLGNSLKVEVCPVSASDTSFAGWTYASRFTAAPGTSEYASNKGGVGDEMHVVVVDEGGEFTGTAGTVLEEFAFVSQASDAKTVDGRSNYYVNVLNNESEYVWFGGAHDADLTDAGTAASNTFVNTTGAVIVESFSGGADSASLADGDITAGYDLFADSETQDVTFLVQPATTGTVVAEHLISIADARKDCVAFLSPDVADTVGTTTPKANVKAWADSITRTSYAVLDSTALKVYDKYNDQFIWIPASSSVAGLCARTDSVADAWFSPAGLNRGNLLGVTKVAFNPNKTDRDELYQARVNPVVTFPGEGTVLYGDKTALSKPSAFDRINVRRLFNVLKKSISLAAKYQLFEFNDEFTRAQFRNMVEPFLREVQGRRGIYEFAVVCDSTNNTGQVIDSNQFVADIYIKPARSINFIKLNFIATRTDVEFSEIIGQ
jgi:phage tail sheath protein FI